MIGITFEVYQNTLIALRVFFLPTTQKDKATTQKDNKTIDKEFNKVYNITTIQKRGIIMEAQNEKVLEQAQLNKGEQKNKGAKQWKN